MKKKKEEGKVGVEEGGRKSRSRRSKRVEKRKKGIRMEKYVLLENRIHSKITLKE